MKSKRDVMRLAAKLGATVSLNSGPPSLDVGVEAPTGHVWACEPGVHELVGSQLPDESSRNVWDDLYLRMEGGIERCTLDGCCDWCDNN